MSDVVYRRAKPTGERVSVDAVEPTESPSPPWVNRHWFGPINAKHSGTCLICEIPIEPGDQIVHRNPRLVMCSMCATSIPELIIHAPSH